MDDLEDLSRRQARGQNGIDPTRVRPPPWFVGSGRGLVTGVIVVLAVLIALRLWSTVELAREGWRRWHQPPSVGVPPPIAPPAPPAPPPRTMPPPSYNPADWITPDDYPVESIRREEQGTVAIRWEVGATGRVSDCRVERTSGFPRLDAAACDAVRRNGRYSPQGADRPRRSYARRVSWRLPDPR